MNGTDFLIVLSFIMLFAAILGTGWCLDNQLTEIRNMLKKKEEEASEK